MNNINLIFIEEYKRLDNLCKDLLNTDKGISLYIDTLSEQKCTFKNCDNDLKTLKHLRHIRNKLTHEVGSFTSDICTQEDIGFLNNFYERILNQQDPLSIIYNNSKSNYKYDDISSDVNLKNTQKEENIGVFKMMIYIMLVIFIGIALIAFLCNKV